MFEIDDILDRVRQTEEDRSEYAKAAAQWEDMWALKAFDKPAVVALEEDAQEQVTVPTPYNVVHLGRRLISQDPRIEVPSTDVDSKEGEAASRRERFLTAFWQRVNKEQGRIVVSDSTWQSLVRGRHCLEITWVKDLLPTRLQNRRLPILVRTLDPLNVGIKRGPLWTDYAYHKYRDRRSNVRQRYPDLDMDATRSKGPLAYRDEIEVTDFWWTDQVDGAIWHAVLADKQFAIEPTRTDYPDIPIVEGYGDSAPLRDEEMASLSILAPLDGLWQYHCRLASQVGTGLLWAFWPAILVSNDQGVEVPDFDVRPGTTTQVPFGTRVDVVRSDVNMPLAQQMISMIDRFGQESTFPGVMYGDAGSMQAGYGVSILADAARGRVALFRRNLESTIEHANELILGLVETFAGNQGVTVWAKSEKSGEIFHETLKPKDIKGNYENMVVLTPQVPSDDIQKQTMGLRMVDSGIMSKKTFRDRHANIIFPDDEKTRVDIERAQEDPAFAAKVALRAFQDTYPDSWERMIAGTPLEQEAQKQAMLDNPPPPPGMHLMPDGTMMPDAMMQPGGMPGPGMPPDMLPPGMLPPGAMPPQDPNALLPQSPIQPPGMMMDTGLPPEMQGQLTPELMGLGPNVDPILWAQIMGQPLPPGEELDQLSGMPPGM